MISINYFEIRTLQSIERSRDVILVKIFQELEGKFIDYLSDLTGERVAPVGRLVQVPLLRQSRDQDGTAHIIEWLGENPQSSRFFVSSGTEYFPTEREGEEIARGLERSNINFIWVLRFPQEERPTKLEDALPRGFLERVGERERGRGKVVENWAPQARVFGHSRIGGFASHCGCGPVMESMKLGAPIVALPMHLDQPFNAMFVGGGKIGVGAEVRTNPRSGKV